MCRYFIFKSLYLNDYVSKGLLRPDGQTLSAKNNFIIAKVKNQYTITPTHSLPTNKKHQPLQTGVFFIPQAQSLIRAGEASWLLPPN